MSIRERIIQAAYDSDISEAADFGAETAALAAAREMALIIKERLLSNTEAVPPPGLLTPMQVAAAQIERLLAELSDGQTARE